MIYLNLFASQRNLRIVSVYLSSVCYRNRFLLLHTMPRSIRDRSMPNSLRGNWYIKRISKSPTTNIHFSPQFNQLCTVLRCCACFQRPSTERRIYKFVSLRLRTFFLLFCFFRKQNMFSINLNERKIADHKNKSRFGTTLFSPSLHHKTARSLSLFTVAFNASAKNQSTQQQQEQQPAHEKQKKVVSK